MKSMLNKILIVGMVLLFTGSLFADPVSPVGSGRVPPSSGARQGLHRSPNPIDSNINDVITGNISGDKYFRGSVPYNSTTGFGLTSTSSSVESFRRRSSDSSVYNYNTGRYKPYYSSSDTVTIMKPGKSTVFEGARIDFSSKATSGTSNTGALSDVKTVNPNLQLFSNQVRPIQQNSEEMKRIVNNDLEMRYKNLQTEEIDTENKAQKVNPELEKVKEQVEELEKVIKEKQQANSEKNFSKEVKESEHKTELTEADVLMAKIERNEKLDIYDQMRIEAIGLGQMLKAKQEVIQDETLTPERMGENAMKDPTPEKLVIEAKTFKTLAAFRTDKFNDHLRLAEAYLKEGKYYRAESAYSIAEMYKPGDPLVYAGKSQALFAAGEFMSSAYYLSEAVRIFPEIVKVKIDLAAIVGSKDVIESRCSDVEEILEKFNNVELKFLLSYVYYQTGRIDRAKELIDEAYETNPDLQIIQLVRAEIDGALN